MKDEMVDRLVVCSIRSSRSSSPSEHCIYQCRHALYHLPDDCKGFEMCDLHESGKPLKVKCRKLNKKEKKQYLKNKN